MCQPFPCRSLIFGFALGLAGLCAAVALADPRSEAQSRAHAALGQEPPDWERARAAFLEAAEAGSPTAMSYLGWMYERGQGVEADGGQAAAWYARAAEAGALDYAVKLGWMFLAGQGVPADRARAEQWFGQAIAADHTPARIALASVLIADALGGQAPERIPEARALLEQALDAGNTLAAYFLARLYLEGIGGHPLDAVRGAEYARIGAEAGHARLQGWLASLYATGRGLEPDPVSALMWANLAAANGDRFGEQVRLELEQRLSAEQVAEARRRAVAWAMRR